jgi:hypothetical protein
VNARFLFALLALASLNACSNKEEPVLQGVPVAASTPAPNSGKILQLMQAAGYTYAEVQIGGGQSVWIAGGPLQLKVGDSVQWGDYAVMQNFSSRALGRTFEEILFVNAWGAPGGSAAKVAPHGSRPADQLASPSQLGLVPQVASTESGQGRVKDVAIAGGYTYLEIEQNGSAIWIAGPKIAVQAGQKVTWNGGALMENFAAKALGRTFDRIIFVGNITLVQ